MNLMNELDYVSSKVLLMKNEVSVTSQDRACPENKFHKLILRMQELMGDYAEFRCTQNNSDDGIEEKKLLNLFDTLNSLKSNEMFVFHFGNNQVYN